MKTGEDSGVVEYGSAYPLLGSWAVHEDAPPAEDMHVRLEPAGETGQISWVRSGQDGRQLSMAQLGCGRNRFGSSEIEPRSSRDRAEIELR